MSEPWHGTDGGYNNHACRCPDCRTAHSAAQKAISARARARAAADPALIPHGTYHGYRYWGCRCEQCTKANSTRPSRARR